MLEIDMSRHKYQCRVPTKEDYHSAPMIQHEIKKLSSDEVALMLASALNELEEQRTLAKNQRKRLAELEGMTHGVRPKNQGKYFPPAEDSTGLLDSIRRKHNAPSNE